MNVTTTQQLRDKKLFLTLSLAALLAMLVADPALAGAGGGFAQAQTTVDNVVVLLTALALGIVTIAIMWAGYKVLFQKNTLSDVAYILIGGTLIGGAAGAAAWIVG